MKNKIILFLALLNISSCSYNKVLSEDIKSGKNTYVTRIIHYDKVAWGDDAFINKKHNVRNDIYVIVMEPNEDFLGNSSEQAELELLNDTVNSKMKVICNAKEPNKLSGPTTLDGKDIEYGSNPMTANPAGYGFTSLLGSDIIYYNYTCN